jgi:hypothetical protein
MRNEMDKGREGAAPVQDCRRQSGAGSGLRMGNASATGSSNDKMDYFFAKE